MIRTVTLGTLYTILKVVGTILSLWFSLRKIYRLVRTRTKRKPPI